MEQLASWQLSNSCVYILHTSTPCYSKNRDTKMTEKTHAFSLSLALSYSPYPLFSYESFHYTLVPLVLRSSHWHPPPPPSLGSPSLGCQMYYRVKRSNVNTESCHGCRVVWPSPSPPSLSLWPRGGGVQRKRVRGGGERSSSSVICVLVRTTVFSAICCFG